jgi:ABC-2 type transport system ATP-binding protein
MPVAEISQLTVRYGNKIAVEDLTVTVPDGCVGLLGPNGAGKTTLIKTLLGFLRPSSGTATVLGRDALRDGIAIRQRVGFMPEIDCYIPGMNAVTFVAYVGELAGLPASAAIRRAHEVLEYCGLGEARYRNVETYSTGMKQRVKLAQALVHGPEFLLLDEPTNGLDPGGRDDMLALVRDISHGKNVNVLVSSHLLPDIETTCDRVTVLRGGQVATQGDIAALRVTEGVQVDIELREASDTFVSAIRKQGGKAIALTGPRYRVTLPDGTVEVGKRLFIAARESGTQLRGFQPALRSLEDVFLEAVE